MATLGFVHYTSSGQILAGEETIKSIRKFYPEAFYMVICDAGSNYYDICKKYNLEYYHSQRKMGYPSEPYGYELQTVLEFWERFYIACFRTNTTHLMYVEEDIKVLKPITVPDDVEVYGFDSCWANGEPFEQAGFPQKFMDMIYAFSGAYPNVNSYGAEGGTIYKVQTFLENYPKIKQWMIDNYDYVKYNVYPKMGWQDSFGTYFYLLSGKKFTKNPRIVNVFDPEDTKEFDYYGHYEYPKEYAVTKGVPDYVEVLHHYKKYYV